MAIRLFSHSSTRTNNLSRVSISNNKRGLVTPNNQRRREERNNRNQRKFHAEIPKDINWKLIIGGFVATGILISTATANAEEKSEPNYEKIRKEISEILDDENYDDGSLAPILLRLAWHASGTYNQKDKTGGSDGATMRFAPESEHGANAGLKIARDKLESIKKKNPEISYSDLWSLAAVVAIEAMGGPTINWRPGRSDLPDGNHCTRDGLLPDASKGADHIREVFGRMGFSDQEIVALVGAHAVGRCHTDRSGYSGPWTNSPTVFSNDFFVQLLENKWTVKKWKGPKQYEDPSGQLMMLPSDMALIEDPKFRTFVEKYAKDQDLFFKDFAAAFEKLEELGCKNLKPRTNDKSWWKFW